MRQRGLTSISPPRSAMLDATRVGLILLLLLPVFAIYRQGLADPDLWWHLEAGRWIAEHRAVPWQDPFSYTALGRPWIAYSWSVELLFYGLTRAWGFDALIHAAAAAAALLVGLIYLAGRAAGAGARAALAASTLAGAATSGGWAERPQLFSLVLLAALVWGLRSARVRQYLPWLAPPLFAVWANVHVGFAVGLGVLALAAACEWIDGRHDGRLCLAMLGAGLATLANPYGWSLLEHVFVIAEQPMLARAIEEFQSPDFASPLGRLIGLFLLASVATLALRRDRLTTFELASYLVTLAGGLYMARNMALFAIVAAPTVARHADPWLRTPPRPATPMPRLLLWLHYGLVLGAIGAAASLAPRAAGWRENVAPGAFPVAAADFVAERYADKRLFNDFDSGGFLIFRLSGRTRVSIDGRTQVYGPKILRAYLRTHFVAPGWDEFLRDCGPEVVIWPASAPFAAVLAKLPGWTRAFADATAVVFVRADAA